METPTAAQAINKDILINASQEKVWEVLVQDHYTRLWYACFHEGAHAITDWQQGSKALFLDNTQNGLVGTVRTSRPHELLEVVYAGLVMNGVEDTERDDAKAVKGGQEIYHLTPKDNQTCLTISADMAPEYFDAMAGAWDTALLKIKELSEGV